MTRISVELVPRDIEVLKEEVKTIKEKLSDVDFINIPDLLSCDTRSWDGANIAKAYFDDVVPHLRAMDFDFTKELPIKDKLREYNIKKDESKIEELVFENINITYADNAKSGVAAMMLGCDEASRQGMVVSNIKNLILKNVHVTGCDGEKIIADNVDAIVKE